MNWWYLLPAVLLVFAVWRIWTRPEIYPGPPKPTIDKPPLTLWDQLVAANGCIKCDKKPKGFVEGPRGGICVNTFCSQCGQGYNLAPMAQHAELIHRDERYIIKTTEGDK